MVVCEARPPVVVHATPEGTWNNTFGAHIMYTCVEGYSFRRGVYTEGVRCAEDGTWQPQTLEFQRE